MVFGPKVWNFGVLTGYHWTMRVLGVVLEADKFAAFAVKNKGMEPDSNLLVSGAFFLIPSLSRPSFYAVLQIAARK